MLAEHDGIHVSRSALNNLLRTSGLSSPQTHRASNRHPARPRMEQEGFLVQIDATPYEWWNEEKACLHGAIDDATGKILSLHFEPTECMDGYFIMLTNLVTKHGIPLAIYADRHTIFQAPSKEKHSIDDELAGKPVPLSQFEAAVALLGSKLIAAGSPQAKGRIERLWNTLQSRLAAELRLHKRTSIEAANAFLPAFIARFNRKFAVTPKSKGKAYLPRPKASSLKYILCAKYTRHADRGACFSFRNVKYQLMDKGKPLPVEHGTCITVLLPVNGMLKASVNSVIYSVRNLDSASSLAWIS